MSPAHVSNCNVALRMPIVSLHNEFVTGTINVNVTLLKVAVLPFSANVHAGDAVAYRRMEKEILI